MIFICTVTAVSNNKIMEEFCSSGSNWFPLIQAFELYIQKSLEQETSSLKLISESCLSLKHKCNLNFSDVRQWQYFHLLIYTNILNEKKKFRVIQNNMNNKTDFYEFFNQKNDFNFRYRLKKHMRNVETVCKKSFRK